MKKKGPIVRYLMGSVYLTLLLVFINLLVYVVSYKGGVILSLGILIYVGSSFAIYLKQKPLILNEMAAFSSQYETFENQLLTEMELPFAIADPTGQVIWGNDAFCAVTEHERLDRFSLDEVFVKLSAESAPPVMGDKKKRAEETTAASAKEETKQKQIRDIAEKKQDNYLVQVKDRLFRLQIRRISINSLELPAEIFEDIGQYPFLQGICLYDETQFRKIQDKYEDEKLVVGLAYLDNYEEALESVEEVRRSLLIALIDRRVGKYFSDFDGIVRKLEKDKYFLVLKNSSLERLKEDRFQILEDVKSVNIGNSMALTISIGIGLNGISFRQNNEYARIAMEMALGRGGDQAAVKDGQTITYWGGKSLQPEKNTRVKARMKAQALKEFLSAKDRVLCMGHKITDVDALGASIGVYRACKTLGKQAQIVINDPSTSIRPLIAGYMEDPEYEQDMFIDSARAMELADEDTVVVVVDTNKPSYTECPELLSRTKTIVVLDHHRRGNEGIDNAVLSYVEPYASSACEMVAEILQYFSEDLKLRSLEADCLYAGIVIDTNNFTTRAGVRTFEAAAYLRRNGADTTRVRKMLRDNIDSYKAKAEAVRTAEIYRDYYAIAVCPGEGLESPTVVGAQAANELLNIAGVKASFVLTRFKQEVYISARAIDEVNVQLMMEKLGGGGHLNVAGAQMKGSEEEVKKSLEKIIDEFIEEGGSRQ